MQVVILSGGSGMRLWPLSNSVRSKQFLPLFLRDDGSFESMLQRTYRFITQELPGVGITITTSELQKSTTISQLGDVDICIEPKRKDTLAAICLAAAYLRDVKGISEDEVFIACSSDGDCAPSFYTLFRRMEEAILAGSNLACMGVEPTYPSEKYGYSIPVEYADVSLVKRFVEKPDRDLAKELIQEGAMWNAGVYGMRIGYALEKAHELLGCDSYHELFVNYGSIKPISFDYAVTEHESNLSVIRYRNDWRDLGTWATLSDSLVSRSMGKVVADENCKDSLIINELNMPLLALGLENMVVCCSADGILVANRAATSTMKPYVDAISDAPRKSEKLWGSYEALYVDDEALTIRVVLNPGSHMNYHSHEHRDETWTIVSGTGYVIKDGVRIDVGPGSMVELPRGCAHSLVAKTRLVAIEVQFGKDIHVEDKHILDWDFS